MTTTRHLVLCSTLAMAVAATGCAGEATPLAATCSPSDNPLRLSCTARFADPTPLRLELSRSGEATRTFTSPAQRSHAVDVWGLPADTRWTWSAQGLAGQIRTGPLPARFPARLSVEGTLEGTDAVLVPLVCGGELSFTMVDGSGRIVWYGDNPAFTSRMDGYAWSPADQSLLAARRDLFVEVDVLGEERLRLEGEVHTGALHHDLARWRGLTYLLHRVNEDGLMVDGIDVFDGQTRLGTWRITDDFPPPPDSTVADYSHSNGIEIDADGRIVLSVRNFDSVLILDGDPRSDTFLQLLHAIGGGPRAPASVDIRAAAGRREGFARQHNASWVDDRLWLFDNLGVADGSRAARYRIDDDTLYLEAEWPLGVACPVQGGAEPIDGGVLVTCADEHRVLAFREGSIEPIWGLEARCDDTMATPVLNRAIPIRLR